MRVRAMIYDDTILAPFDRPHDFL